MSAAMQPGETFATPGVLLRQAREAAGLSVADIASRLRMGARQVSALEAADYAALPSGTFLRGFVRNYANAVGLESNAVLELLERTHGAARPIAATPVVEPANQKMQVRDPGGPLASRSVQRLVWLLVAVLLGAAAWYWWSEVMQKRGAAAPVVADLAKPVTQPVQSVLAVPVDSALPSQPITAVAEAAPERVPAPGGGSTAIAATIPAEPAQVAPQGALNKVSLEPANPAGVPVTKSPGMIAKPGMNVLGFTFSGESWVEVVDGNGRTILSRRFRAGEAEEIAGKPPLRVVVGNSSVTRMAVNGQEFDLAPHTKVAVARLTVQ
ncbi:MAG TPA: RodZ domain-containing protein [Usitatibacteraceae bacterium]|nr:RodZ domain-containing protein [Usitatibacteraceae bacterium]